MQSTVASVEFRKAMGEFATGITVVTTLDGELVRGMTANSFTSVSLNPPLILVSVDKRANHFRYIAHAKRFGVSVLAAHQEEVSRHFAGHPSHEIESSLRYTQFQGIPVLEDCNMWAACRLWATYDGGDHALFVGEVLSHHRTDGEPLLFYRGQYRVLHSSANASV
ncbi:flavin reductase family protein [Alicyclobacillus fastidiosus]|uniref:Flavin reductase family protein n=1 Tax=Alicyclobacillus fastidiosus TaxID=392011 RepID=A0ABY6ZGE3_9BACL|nr:flavin reductase family protein [Alicyclobacillus fastidiosus]WAH41189.1 flavin reductase family protein [Alicyclobacillus fastidiosus]GMA62767.1 flavin oxidoreductase [Alicyclobacillus fastidiosus]